jgi:hypothetical protein
MQHITITTAPLADLHLSWAKACTLRERLAWRIDELSAGGRGALKNAKQIAVMETRMAKLSGKIETIEADMNAVGATNVDELLAFLDLAVEAGDVELPSVNREEPQRHGRHLAVFVRELLHLARNARLTTADRFATREDRALFEPVD